MRPVTILRGFIFAFVFPIGCRQDATEAQKAPKPAHPTTDNEPIPSDFRIVAQYGAGYSPWKSWKVTITGDGIVAKEGGFQGGGSAAEERGTKEQSGQTTLSGTDLRELLAEIKEADFYGLREEYSYSVTDNPTLVLTITQNKRTHRVSVYAYNHLKDDKDVKRFLRVWSKLLRKVPSPNPDDKPDDYEPQASAAERFRNPTWPTTRNSPNFNPGASARPSSEQKSP